MIKNKLEWYVLYHDFNANKIAKFNVLNGWEERLTKARKHIKCRQELYNWLDTEFRHYYWCRSECEILVGGLFVNDIDELTKIDIYTQLVPNLNVITDYIINSMNFKFRS